MSSIRLGFVTFIVTTIALLSPAAAADHDVADCPLSLVGEVDGATDFFDSPHGIFSDGSVVYVLRGNTLSTYDLLDSGELSILREDALDNLAASDVEGGTAFSNGYLFVTSGEGLEIYDLRGTQGGAGGQPPAKISRTLIPHYREIAVSGDVLAALSPADELHCMPNGSSCVNSIDIYSVANLSEPTLMSRIMSTGSFVGFNDIAFANGFLYATGSGGTHAFDVSDPSSPNNLQNFPTSASWLATNGSDILAIGQETLIGVFNVGPGSNLSYSRVVTLPAIFDLSNDLRFSEEAWINNDRLITLVNTVDPMTLEPARTIAFAVFDFSIPIVDGFYERLYENITYVESNEVLHNPMAAGPFVYVTGDHSGTQVWGACGELTGRIELEDATSQPCGGAEIHGWVTGQNPISKVELFLDGTLLGTAEVGRERHDVSSRHVVRSWGVNVNLDETPEGLHTLHAVATDVEGNTRQFASKVYRFGGPGDNCVDRRKGARRGN